VHCQPSGKRKKQNKKNVNIFSNKCWNIFKKFYQHFPEKCWWKRFGKILDLTFSLNKCWCHSFQKMLDHLFTKNGGSTFYLQNVVTFFKNGATFFKRWEGWKIITNNFKWTLVDYKFQLLSTLW
jgi:hypothetical protein